jgi:hypothetical protein
MRVSHEELGSCADCGEKRRGIKGLPPGGFALAATLTSASRAGLKLSAESDSRGLSQSWTDHAQGTGKDVASLTDDKPLPQAVRKRLQAEQAARNAYDAGAAPKAAIACAPSPGSR